MESLKVSYNHKPIYLSLQPFPRELEGQIKGMACPYRDGYLIIIDESCTEAEMVHVLGHELAHIFKGHLDRKGVIADLEAEAEENADAYYQLFAQGKLPA